MASTTTPAGSFGYLYEVLITASIARLMRPQIDIDTKYNYLADLAYHMFTTALRVMPAEQLKLWHSQYCSTYKIQLDFRVMWDELASSGISEERKANTASAINTSTSILLGATFETISMRN